MQQCFLEHVELPVAGAGLDGDVDIGRRSGRGELGAVDESAVWVVADDEPCLLGERGNEWKAGSIESNWRRPVCRSDDWCVRRTVELRVGLEKRVNGQDATGDAVVIRAGAVVELDLDRLLINAGRPRIDTRAGPAARCCFESDQHRGELVCQRLGGPSLTA